MNLSPHFTHEELTHSDLAVRRGLDNTPPIAVAKNLEELAAKLEAVRALLGHPVIVSSGYRSTEVNAAIGGSPTSAHCHGRAADFICPAYGSPKSVALAIRDSGIKFDQLIWEGTWVHLSFDPKMRGQVMTARFDTGRAVYSQDID